MRQGGWLGISLGLVIAVLAGFAVGFSLTPPSGAAGPWAEVAIALALAALAAAFGIIVYRQSLVRSEARLHSVIDSAMDAIIAVDDKQRIVLFNGAAEVMFGCGQSEAIGGALSQFIPERFRAGHVQHIERFAHAGITSRRMGASRVVMGLRRGGGEFPIDASISQVRQGAHNLYTVILRDVSERVAQEALLRQSREQLRDLATAAHHTREQEQRRIARELHDELGQSLTALKMMVVAVDNVDPPVMEKLQRMQHVIDDTLGATRRLASELRPLILDDLGLFPAIEWLLDNFRERAGVACALAVHGGDVELDDTRATAVFRILQEALTNITRHASASQVDLTIRHGIDDVTITVIDDGVGFSMQDALPTSSRGLLGMRERAYLLGGQLEIVSAPGKGTTLEVRLPLANAEAWP